MEHEIPRSQYRFDNYKRAFQLLREAVEQVVAEIADNYLRLFDDLHRVVSTRLNESRHGN